MRDLPFSQKVFNTGYGLIYTVYQYTAVICFMVAIVLMYIWVCYPTLLQWNWMPFFLGGCMLISSAVFSAAMILKNRRKRSVLYDRIYFRKGYAFAYEHAVPSDVDDLDTSVAYYIYTILRVDQITIGQRYCVITGDIRQHIRCDGRTSGRKNVKDVTIPNAFADIAVLYSAVLLQSTS